MAEPDNGDLRRELGISRRDLMRRGALVGGTLLWAAPVIQSLSPPAFAHSVSPATHFCCHCFNEDGSAVNGNTGACLHIDRGGSFRDGHQATAEHCAHHCSQLRFDSSNFHKSPTPMTCTGSHPDQGGGCSGH